MAARCPRVAPRETSAAKPPDPTHTPRQHLRRRASLCMRASLRQLHQAARAYSSLSASRGVSNLATTFARLRRGPMQRSVFDEPAVVATFAEAGVNPKHAGTVRKLALARLRANAAAVPTLNDLQEDEQAPGRSGERVPVAAWGALRDAGFVILSTRVAEASTSSAGDTTKLRIEMGDGKSVEAVIMRHDPRNGTYGGEKRGGEPRATLCVSSQVGCQMACTFCATGTMGLIRSLTAGEIVEQLVHASRTEPIRNIVFMGMGEPLANFQNVVAAIKVMTEPLPVGLGVGPSKVTVSTVGVVPRMKQLGEELPAVKLALSLHAPNQELRERIVPTAKAYKVDKLLAGLDAHAAATGSHAFVEYVLLAGVNDQPEHARELGALLKGHECTLNLIPFNPVIGKQGKVPYEAPTQEACELFRSIVQDEFGVMTTTRRTMGQDIAGACGQLVIKREQQQQKELRDIEDMR